MATSAHSYQAPDRAPRVPRVVSVSIVVAGIFAAGAWWQASRPSSVQMVPGKPEEVLITVSGPQTLTPQVFRVHNRRRVLRLVAEINGLNRESSSSSTSCLGGNRGIANLVFLYSDGARWPVSVELSACEAVRADGVPAGTALHNPELIDTLNHLTRYQGY